MAAPVRIVIVVLATVSAAGLATTGCASPEAQAARHLESAQEYLEDERYDEAVIEYRNAVQQQPLDGQARRLLAEAYARAGRPQEGVPELVRAADLLPDDIELQLEVARLMLLGQQFDAARARAGQVVQRDPSNVDAHIVVASSMAGLREFEGALAAIQEAIRLEPTRALTYTGLGLIQQAQGARQEAEAAFLRAIEIDVTSVEARIALVNFYLSDNLMAEAEAVLREVLILDPDNLAASQALANVYLATNRLDEAEAHLLAVTRSSSEVGPRLTLADLYLRTDRADEAIAVLDEAVDQPGGFAPATVALARIDRAGGDAAPAYARLDAVLEQEPANAGVLALQAQWLSDDGELDRALAIATEAVEYGPRTVEAHYVLGLIQLRRQQFAEARTALQEALRLNPQLLAAEVGLAQVFLGTGDLDGALQTAEAVNVTQPGHPDALLVMSRALLGLQRPNEAATHVQALVANYPNLAAGHALRGGLHALEGEDGLAQQSFDTALDLDPSDFTALAGLTGLDVRAGRTAEALARLTAANAASPDNLGIVQLTAQVHAAAGDVDATERSLKNLIALGPERADSYLLLGQFYAGQERLDEARVQFDEAAARGGAGPAVADTRVAQILEAQGQTGQARERYELILRNDPREATAANNLAYLLAESGEELDRALRLAQMAQAQFPDDPRVNDTVGWVYYKQDSSQLGLEYFQRASELDPDNPEYHYHLGLAHADVGDQAQARVSLTRALDLDPDLLGASQALAALGSVAEPQ